MQTRSVDLAAYLHLAGIEPDEVTLNEKFKVREFRYKDSDMLHAVVDAFHSGGVAPVKTFCEARAEMKSRNHGSRNAVRNFRRAVDDAREQLRR